MIVPTADCPLRACCPVCGTEVDLSVIQPTVVRALRGEQTWGGCPQCHAWFQMGDYNLDQEVAHTRTTPWGMQQSGLELNQYKARMFESVLQLLKKHGAMGGTLLDVGTSYGGFLLAARAQGFDVRGMDIVPEAIEYLRKQGIACETAMSVGALNLSDASLNVVTALDCIYYWPDHGKELRHIRQKLRPGGLLALRTATKYWMFRAGVVL